MPPIIKGTDSRMGFGFRLGEHADFQKQFELGPQKFTKPIGNGASEDSDTYKRMVDQAKYNKRIKPVISNGRAWLKNWAADMKMKSKRTSKKKTANLIDSPIKNLFSTADQYPIPMAPVIVDTSLRQLQQLYGKTDAPTGAENGNDQSLGTLPANSIAAYMHAAAREQKTRLKKEQIKADLMDVSFDE